VIPRRLKLPSDQHDGKVLTKVKRHAYWLDMGLFNCCGIRFGWSSVIGIIPGYVFEETINTKLNKLLSIGDALDAFMAIMVFRTCQQS
jgi:hypothetical protein